VSILTRLTRRFAGDFIYHPVDTIDYVDDSVGDAGEKEGIRALRVEERMLKCIHEVDPGFQFTPA